MADPTDHCNHCKGEVPAVLTWSQVRHHKCIRSVCLRCQKFLGYAARTPANEAAARDEPVPADPGQKGLFDEHA